MFVPSWGPVGIALAHVIGRIGGPLLIPADHPSPDSRMASFMLALVSWPVLGVLGTAVSIVLGYRQAKRREGTRRW